MSKMDYPDLEPSWTRTRHPDECPCCKASLVGDKIPEKYLDEHGDETHYSRAIWVSSMKRDMGVAYRCPDCKEYWPISGREDLFKEFMEGKA